MSHSGYGVKRAVASVRSRLEQLSKPVIALIVLAVGTVATGTVFAISSSSPDQDPASQGPNSFLVIGRVGGGNTLPSAETNVKLVFENAPSVVDVFDGPWCNLSLYGDRRADPANDPCTNPDPTTNVFFDFQAIDNNTGAAVGPMYRVNSWQMAQGGGVNNNYRVNLAGNVAAVKSTDGRYFVQVKVHWETQNPAFCTSVMTVADGCYTGSDFFRMNIPNGVAGGTNYITYATTNGSSDPLTVETAGPGVARTDESDITFEFAPPCGANDATRLQPLKWTDADYGQSNETGDNIGWDLYEIAPAGTSTHVAGLFGPAVGGNGVTVQTAPYQFKDGYKYRWTWRNVDSSNGVQVFFPFDSYNYIRNCATASLDKTTNAKPNQEVGAPFAFFVKITHNGPSLVNMTVNDTMPAGLSYVPAGSFNTPPPSSVVGGNITWNFPNGSPELNTINTTGVLVLQFKAQGNAPGTYTNTATGNAVDVNGSPVFVGPGKATVTIISIDLTNKPYFQVRGGDIAAGAGMDLGGSQCSQPGGLAPHGKASIVSWNQGSGTGYAGAGAQHGAFVLNHLQSFVTGQGSPYDPGGLSFANTGGDGQQYSPVGELYGGELGNMPCTPDYLQGATGGVAGGQRLSTILGIAPGSTYNLANGAPPQTIYVPSGDILVDVNVRYSGNYANAADIPAFAVLVRGNIYIDNSVNQLDGFYVAQPTDSAATNGIVYTCAPFGLATNALNTLTRNLSSNCGNRLTFNGAVTARQIWLLRTFGSLAVNQPAEVFNYVPELWLNTPYTAAATTGTVDNYDAITSLPPIL